MEGCVTREADIPGRRPNVAERAGITEDFVLTNARVIKGSAPATGSPAAGAATPGTTPGSAGVAGQGTMFEIEGLDGDQRKQHLNRRVQLEGAFENVGGNATQASPRPTDDLVEIRATSIRPVAGDCPMR